MEKNPEIQFRSPEDIKSYQEEQLTKALAYLQAHSKFYQQMFAEHHIDINQIKTIEDLQQIPVTTKTDLQLHNDDFICMLDGGKSVCNHDSGTVLAQFVQRILNVVFGHIVQSGGRFIQNKDWRVL